MTHPYLITDTWIYVGTVWVDTYIHICCRTMHCKQIFLSVPME